TLRVDRVVELREIKNPAFAGHGAQESGSHVAAAHNAAGYCQDGLTKSRAQERSVSEEAPATLLPIPLAPFAHPGHAGVTPIAGVDRRPASKVRSARVFLPMKNPAPSKWRRV